MSISVKLLHGGGVQAEDDANHWVIFSLDELRSRSATLRADIVGGSPELPRERADLFVWAAFAAARGYAVEHGLVEYDRPSSPA
jgi:hypothetical protein